MADADNPLRSIVAQARALWDKLPTGRRWIIVAAVAATIGLSSWLAVRSGIEDYEVVMSGQTPEDVGHAAELLKAQSIPFHIEGGSVIKVPTTHVHDARIALAINSASGNDGWNLFDKQQFGSTSHTERINAQRALQGELEKAIKMVDGVARAHVILAVPEERLIFANQDKATASVTLGLKPGRRLSPGQARAIVHMVASAVEGLTPERVSVVDGSGALLWTGGEENAEEMQQASDREVAQKVKAVLEPMLGPGHFEVVVTAEMDLSRKEVTQEEFGKESKVRSETKSEEKTTQAALATGGVVGAQGNLPGAAAPTPAPSGGSSQKTSEAHNYELDRTVTKTVGPKQTLKRLHVAVLVDYARKPGAPALESVPRTDDEMKNIEAIARRAAGLDTERGDLIEVLARPFWVDPQAVIAEAEAAKTAWWKSPATLAAVAIPAVLLVVVLATVLRRRKPDDAQADLPMLPATVGELEKKLPEHAAQAQLGPPDVRTRVTALARNDAARAAEVIAAWLSETPPNNEAKHP